MLTCNPLDLAGVAKGVNEARIWLKFGGLAESAGEAEMLERNRVKVSTCAQLSRALPQFPSTVLVFRAPGVTTHSLQSQMCLHFLCKSHTGLLCVVTKCLVGCHSVVAGPLPQEGLGLFEHPSWGHSEWCNIGKLGLFMARFPLLVAQELFIPTRISPYRRNRRPSLFPCFEEWLSDVFR